LGVVLLLGAAFFIFRNAALRSVLDGKIRSYEKGNNSASVQVGSARFSGLAGVVLEDIRVRSAGGDLDVELGKCRLQVSLWNMLIGRVRPKRLELNDLTIDLRQETSPRPLPARPAVQAPAAPVPGPPPDYAARVAYLLDVFFTRIPDTFVINRLTIRSEIDQVKQALQIPRLAIEGLDFATTIEVNDLENKRAYYLTGSIDRGEKRLAIHLLPQRRGEAAALPFIDRQWGLRVSFDSLTIGLESRGRRDGVLRLDGSLAVGGLILNHPRIAAEDVNLPGAALDYVLNIGPDFFELDKRTLVNFDRLRFHPYLKFKTRPTRQLTLKIERTRFKADDLFSSLPAGLFTHLAGIRTSGELAYHLDFAIDLDRPEGVELESELEKTDFKIEHFGRVDFRAVNAPFLYTAYEKDRAMRSFMVGPENPDFRFFDQIPAYLKNAVMISEDGAFFDHKGFLIEPIKDSIVTNLRAGRFVRGASTISMQLVKNLYLKRQKTIARKLEEMLITWLIEEKRLISKQRMFEIYLNIIEWGPGVYGAEGAARYYFDKEVAAITLPEAIFLASIIPRPKRFIYSFDENQHLRSWLNAYYRDVSYKMLKREWISQEDYDALVPDVRLKGPARLLLKGVEAPAGEPPDEDEPDWP
jgi:hypothetical protein